MRYGILSDTQIVNDCPEYQPIPMKVVSEVLKVPKEENDYAGIKQIYRKVPPRPMNINALATSLSQMGKNRAVPLAVAYPSVAEAIKADIRPLANFERETGDLQTLSAYESYLLRGGFGEELKTPIGEGIFGLTQVEGMEEQPQPFEVLTREPIPDLITERMPVSQIIDTEEDVFFAEETDSPPQSVIQEQRLIGMNEQQLLSLYERGRLTREQLGAGIRDLRARVSVMETTEGAERRTGVRRVASRLPIADVSRIPRRAGVADIRRQEEQLEELEQLVSSSEAPMREAPIRAGRIQEERAFRMPELFGRPM